MLMCCTASSACFPRMRMSPMWLTSKTPTPVRTAVCSAMRPEYSTGISQPPKSTIFAPRRRCIELRAVLRRVGADVSVRVDKRESSPELVTVTERELQGQRALDTGSRCRRRDGSALLFKGLRHIGTSQTGKLPERPAAGCTRHLSELDVDRGCRFVDAALPSGDSHRRHVQATGETGLTNAE